MAAGVAGLTPRLSSFLAADPSPCTSKAAQRHRNSGTEQFFDREQYSFDWASLNYIPPLSHVKYPGPLTRSFNVLQRTLTGNPILSLSPIIPDP